jgi:hypothetical protein
VQQKGHFLQIAHHSQEAGHLQSEIYRIGNANDRFISARTTETDARIAGLDDKSADRVSELASSELHSKPNESRSMGTETAKGLKKTHIVRLFGMKVRAPEEKMRSEPDRRIASLFAVIEEQFKFDLDFRDEMTAESARYSGVRGNGAG